MARPGCGSFWLGAVFALFVFFLYALGTLTTGISLLVIVVALLMIRALRRGPARPAG